VLRRGDGVFAYQLAVVVDDGQWTSRKSYGVRPASFHRRQILLHRLLGQREPRGRMRLW